MEKRRASTRAALFVFTILRCAPALWTPAHEAICRRARPAETTTRSGARWCDASCHAPETHRAPIGNGAIPLRIPIAKRRRARLSRRRFSRSRCACEYSRALVGSSRALFRAAFIFSSKSARRALSLSICARSCAISLSSAASISAISARSGFGNFARRVFGGAREGVFFDVGNAGFEGQNRPAKIFAFGAFDACSLVARGARLSVKRLAFFLRDLRLAPHFAKSPSAPASTRAGFPTSRFRRFLRPKTSSVRAASGTLSAFRTARLVHRKRFSSALQSRAREMVSVAKSAGQMRRQLESRLDVFQRVPCLVAQSQHRHQR